MTDLSLSILDIANNSTRAKAKKIGVFVALIESEDKLTVTIKDNGCGMTKEFLQRVTDPFSTTRTTRKVGMGLPLYKMTAEMAGGNFFIESEVGKGTTVQATFGLSHIDRPPLGDLAETFITLIGGAPECEFEFSYSLNDSNYFVSTEEIKAALEVDTLQETFVLSYIRDMIKENIDNINGGKSL